MATPKIVPRAQGGGKLGDTDFGWGGVYITSVAESSATAGGLLEIGCNDGAAMADNHRLGAISFKGAEDDAGTLSVGAKIQAICRDAWDGDENDADLEFYTTNGTTESKVLTLDADKLAAFTGAITGASTIDAATDFTVGSTVISDDSIVMTPTTGDTLEITSTTHGASTIKTIDTAAAAAHINIDADGDVYLKNSTTTHAQVTASGMTSTNKRTIWIPIQNMRKATTNGAEEADKEYHETDSGTVRQARYDDTTSQYMDFNMVMPEQWDLGTMKAKFYWDTDSGTGTVKFGIKAQGMEDGTTLTGWGTEVAITDTRLNNNVLHISPASPAFTVGGTRNSDAWIFFRVRRDVTDTKAGDANLLGVLLEYGEHLTAHTAL